MMNKDALGRFFGLAKRHIWLFAAGATVASGGLWYVIFAFTPVGRLLPPRFDSSLRKDYVELAMRVDSMLHVAESNSRFTANILRILTDSVDTTADSPADPVGLGWPLDSLMDASPAEREFAERHEAASR